MDVIIQMTYATSLHGHLEILCAHEFSCFWCHRCRGMASMISRPFLSSRSLPSLPPSPLSLQIYMTYVQATQGGGGWPMSVFLTPSLEPVLGGTYFPPEDKYGRIGFKSLLT